MHSYLVGLEDRNLAQALIYIPSLCVQAVKTLVHIIFSSLEEISEVT